MGSFWWVRAYWISIVWTIAGIVAASVALSMPDASGLVAPFVQIGGLAPLGFFGVAFASAAWVSFRIWQASRGEGPQCTSCAGPLGQEREGRASRGGPHRKCMVCGTNVNHRHYA